jgi:hypothetical protein
LASAIQSSLWAFKLKTRFSRCNLQGTTAL